MRMAASGIYGLINRRWEVARPAGHEQSGISASNPPVKPPSRPTRRPKNAKIPPRAARLRREPAPASATSIESAWGRAGPAPAPVMPGPDWNL